MRVTVQFDIDATKFDLEDLEAACARMLHVAAARIIKDGTPAPDGLGWELRLSTPEDDIRGKIATEYAEEADSPDDNTVKSLRRHLVTVLSECAESGLADSNPPWYVDAMAAIGLECGDDDLSRLDGLSL